MKAIFFLSKIEVFSKDEGDSIDSSDYNESQSLLALLVMCADNSCMLGSSESEYEDDPEEDINIMQLPVKENTEVSALVHWIVIFVRLWQAMYSISDKAIGLLLLPF